MSEDPRKEIIRRAKWVAQHYGLDMLNASGKSINGICKGIYVLHRLRSGLVDFRIIWIVPEQNLRIGATVYHEDGRYPDSIMIVNTRGEEEAWHDESQNDRLLNMLRDRMVLEDIAGV